MKLTSIDCNYGSCKIVILKLYYSFCIFWLAFYSKQEFPCSLIYVLFILKFITCMDSLIPTIIFVGV